MAQPIVVFGGFLSYSMLYDGMRRVLTQVAGRPVYVVQTETLDWLPSILPVGWVHLLRKLHRTVCQAAGVSSDGKVTLIGHSAGGVLARLYLSPQPFMGTTYRGVDYVDHLITLGSPHYNERRWIAGGMMSRWVERRYPGAWFAEVRYTSVAGSLLRGDRRGSLSERHAYSFYAQIRGQGDVWGDGLIPVASALLAGSQQLTLDGVGHFAGFGGPWYGSEDIVRRWWNEACCLVTVETGENQSPCTPKENTE